MSFSFKLLSVIMVVVVSVTVTTLTLTRRKVESTYQRMLQEQFRSQMGFFFEKQEARFGNIKSRCFHLAKSVRLLAALESGVDPTQLYEIALDELRSVLSPSAEGWDGDGSRSAGDRATFFRLLDAAGGVIATDKSSIGMNEGGTKQSLEEQLARLGPLAIRAQDQQQVGYLAMRVNERESRLNEVIVTKIIDSETQQVRGILVVGFPATEVSSQIQDDAHPVESGMWLDGELHFLEASMGRDLLAKLPLGGTDVHSEGSFHWSQGSRNVQVFYKILNPESTLPPVYRISLFSLDGLTQQQREWSRQILTLGGGALIGALLLGFFFSHSLSTPIRQLVTGTRKIQEGNFDVRVLVRSRDEIGELAGSFNEMAAGLGLKEKYRSVLDMVTDKKVAEELLKGDLALGGEIRDVSVLFCDVRGFTALTEKMQPTQVIELLNEHMTALTKVVYEDHGVVDKFVGDLIMALFGAPRSYGNDAYHAVHSALQMIRQRNQLNETSNYQVCVGIGIASGKVVAGRMGAANRNNYTVLGERVNLASRLCSQAGPGDIIIDLETRNRIGDRFRVEPVAPLKLKGFSETVEAFKVLGLRDAKEA